MDKTQVLAGSVEVYTLEVESAFHRLRAITLRGGDTEQDVASYHAARSALIRAVQASSQQEIEKLKRVTEIQKAWMDGMPLCPDHRDKFKGAVCLACRAEAAEAKLARLQASSPGSQE